MIGPVVSAIVAALDTATPSNVAIGDDVAPQSGAYPYAIVTQIAAAETGFGMSAGRSPQTVVVQVSMIAESRISRDLLADLVTSTMLDPAVSFDTATAVVSDRRLIVTNLTVDRDDQLHRADLRFDMFIAPI